MLVYSSTQHPSEMQHLVAHMLGWPTHNVVVRMPAHGRRLRRQGIAVGEFSRASRRCAAHKLRRPVKLRADRDDDFMITGKRHDAVYTSTRRASTTTAAFSARGSKSPLRAGYSADLSGAVATRAVCHFDNAYYLSRCRHRRAVLQDQHAVEHRVSRLRRPARRARDGSDARQHRALLKRDPLDVRTRQLLRHRRTQHDALRTAVEDNMIAPLTDELARIAATIMRGAKRSPRSTRRARCSSAASRSRRSSSASRSTCRSSIRQARWCTFTTTARCSSITAAPKWARGSTPRSRKWSPNELGMPLSRVRVTRDRYVESRQHVGDGRLDRQRPERQGRRSCRTQDSRRGSPNSPRSNSAARRRRCASPTEVSRTAARCRSSNSSSPRISRACSCGPTVSTDAQSRTGTRKR